MAASGIGGESNPAFAQGASQIFRAHARLTGYQLGGRGLRRKYGFRHQIGRNTLGVGRNAEVLPEGRYAQDAAPARVGTNSNGGSSRLYRVVVSGTDKEGWLALGHGCVGFQTQWTTESLSAGEVPAGRFQKDYVAYAGRCCSRRGSRVHWPIGVVLTRDAKFGLGA